MLYHLFKAMDFALPGSGAFNFISFRAAMAVFASLIISLLFGKGIIKLLRRMQVGETVRDLGLEGQLSKQGTPTMGGLIITSLKRRDQLERAFAILKSHPPPDTPVVIASNLGRPQENVRIVSFADFNPDEVDMLTLVMVGSSQSKSFARRDGRNYAYTPRGYAKKRETP